MVPGKHSHIALPTENSSETAAEVNDRSFSQTALAVHNCSLYEEMRPRVFLNIFRRSLHEGCGSSNDAEHNGSAYCWFAVTLCFCYEANQGRLMRRWRSSTMVKRQKRGWATAQSLLRQILTPTISLLLPPIHPLRCYSVGVFGTAFIVSSTDQ